MDSPTHYIDVQKSLFYEEQHSSSFIGEFKTIPRLFFRSSGEGDKKAYSRFGRREVLACKGKVKKESIEQG